MNQGNNQKLLFTELLQKILKHGGFQINNKVEIKQSDYYHFWDYLNVPDNASLFVIDLLKLTDSTEYSKKTKIYNLENLLCTLLTICMFKKIDIDKRKRELSEAKTQWEHHVNGKKQMTNPYSCSIMENDENSFIGYIIGSVVFLHDLYKVAKPENIETYYEVMKQHYKTVEDYNRLIRIKNDQYYSVLLDERFDLTETGEYMFCYEYILKFIRSKNRNVPRIIYDAIIKYLKMIPFMAQDFPEHAEKSILALLHMTKQFITFFSCDIPEVLKTLLHQVEIYRRWPFPIGVMAEELVTIIYQEWKFRGSSFRMKLREDIPQIDFFNNNNQDHEEENKENEIQFNQIVEQNEKREIQILRVYTFSDEKNMEAQNLLQYAQNQVKNNQSIFVKYYSSHALRTYLVAQILGLELKISTDKQFILASLSEEDIFQLYCKLLLIIEKCDQLDSTVDIKMIQQNAFEEIMREIQRQKYEPTDLQVIIRTVIGDNNLIIPDYPIYYILNAGSKQIFQNQQKMSTLKLESNQSQFQEQYYSIRNFITQAYKNYMPLHTEPLRLLVVGGDQEINKVCSLLGEIYEDNPFYLRTIDLRVYILPCRECALAQFLAVKDPWYQRYLYLPIMEDILIPKLDNIKDDKKEANYERQIQNGIQCLPLELKSQVLNTFIREANRAYNVRVYKIKMYQKPPIMVNQQAVKLESGYKPTMETDGSLLSRVYFCTDVLIGAAAEFELQKEKPRDEKDKIQKMSFYDYKEKNLCKFQFIPINITTHSTDMLGNITKDHPFIVQIHSCKINNVYTDFFEGNMPMPHTDWLELSYISYENSKVFDNNLRQKNLFKKDSKGKNNYIIISILQENLQNAFMSLFTNMSVVKVTMEENQGRTFTMVADGRIYQNINKIKISSVKMKQAHIDELKKNSKNMPDLSQIRNLNLPIMSFLPFKV